MMTLNNFKIDIQNTFDASGRNVTIVQIFDKENKLLSRAKTTRSSKDTFNRALGRKKAMAKAIAKSSIPKTQRALIWEDYRTKMTVKPRW